MKFESACIKEAVPSFFFQVNMYPPMEIFLITDIVSKNDPSADSQSHPYYTERIVNSQDRETRQRESIVFGRFYDEFQ